MPAFVVGTIRVTDAARWQQYVERVASTFGPHGGRVLLRGTKSAMLSGEAQGERIVVIEFPDVEAAQRWHASAEYQALVALRDAAAEVVLAIYDGQTPAR